MVVNSNFNTDTDWTKQAGWTIAAGEAHGAVGDLSSILQAIAATDTVTYSVQFEITNISAGTITPNLSGTAGTVRSTVGVFIEDPIKALKERLINRAWCNLEE